MQFKDKKISFKAPQNSRTSSKQRKQICFQLGFETRPAAQGLILRGGLRNTLEGGHHALPASAVMTQLRAQKDRRTSVLTVLREEVPFALRRVCPTPSEMLSKGPL